MKRICAGALVALALMAFMAAPALGAYTENPYTAGEREGSWVSLIGEDHTIRILESSLTHPSHADGFVDKGDPVYISSYGITGVALESATAATEYINIGLEGIVNLGVTNAATMAIGDEVYCGTSAAALTDSAGSGVLFGHVLTAIATTGSSAVRAVRLVGTYSRTVTGENGDTITNGTDGQWLVVFDDDAVELGEIKIQSSNTSTSDNDYFRISYDFEDSASGQTEGGYIDLTLTDVTTATEDSRLDFGLINAGTLQDELYLLGGTGGSLAPANDDALDLGTSGAEWDDLYVDGTANIDDLAADIATVGSGTSYSYIACGTVDIANGATSATQAVSGMLATDWVFITAAEDPTTGTWVNREPGAFDVEFVGTTGNYTGGAITFQYLVMRD